MNAITGHAASPVFESIPVSPPVLHTLRRTGRKAVRFTGRQLVEALGNPEPGTIWYELSIYRSEADSIIVELIARRSAVDEHDLSRVEVFASLSEAASWLETYPCAADVPIPSALASDDSPMATCVLQALQLRQRISRISDEYHGLLSDVFEALDITDGAYTEQAVDPHA
jgi:hypothetical protein